MAEERKLIRIVGQDARKRGTVIDGLLGWTDEEVVVHIPTGFPIQPPRGPHGGFRADVDCRAYVEHMLKSDPEGWESSRAYGFGEKLTTALQQRLLAVAETFP